MIVPPCLHAFSESHLEACTQMLPRLFRQQLNELPVFFTLEKVWKALFHGFQVDGSNDLLACFSNNSRRGRGAHAGSRGGLRIRA